MEAGEVEKLTSLGLTPALKKLLIHPLNDDEYIETKKLLEETINLTRAAILVGLIEDGTDLEDFSIKLKENSLYRNINIIDPVQNLLENLNLDDWSANDFETLTNTNRHNGKMGVLIDEGKVKAEDQLSIGINLAWALRVGTDFTIERVVDVLPGWSSMNFAGSMGQSSGKYFAGSACTGQAMASTEPLKRKGDVFSPTAASNETYSCSGARKLQRGDPGELGASPVLKIRRGLDTKPKSPPGGGKLTSPAVGRIMKKNRRLATPKRTFTPDRRQRLITSSFSPKVRPQAENDKD